MTAGQCLSHACRAASFELLNKEVLCGTRQRGRTACCNTMPVLTSAGCGTLRRMQQAKERHLLTQTSLQPRNFMTEVHDWKQYYSADWTPDRGSSAYENERRRLRRPALVQTGRWASASRPSSRGSAWL